MVRTLAGTMVCHHSLRETSFTPLFNRKVTLCGIAASRVPPRVSPDLEHYNAWQTPIHRPMSKGSIVQAVGLAPAAPASSICFRTAALQSADGQVCIVFNGEIYNYRELKSELEQQGRQFRTNSDTEVLLALYQHDGLDAFAKINGMLACALWDERTRRLVLVRDRFGKKPLYYYTDERRFVFASELKSILADGQIERRVNAEALHEYLTHGYIEQQISFSCVGNCRWCITGRKWTRRVVRIGVCSPHTIAK